VKPPALRPGDAIGVIAPSWCGPAAFPHRVERGKEALEALGYHVLVAPRAWGQRAWVSGTPEERAADLHAMFADPAVRMIIAAIGGDHCCHLLPFLDWELIRRNPKVFIGFSDVTVLNLAIYVRTGLVTFNGPALMTDFGEYPAPFSYTVDSFLRTVGVAKPAGAIEPAREWTEEFLDWATQDDLRRPRAMQGSPGWTWLKGSHAEGKLVGGCLESLEHLRGTPYWPDLEGSILFLETSELAPPPERVDAMLQDYENMGVFAQIHGLLLGRPYRYSDAQKQELHAVLLERTRRYSFPIIADMDFGHTAPQLTLPIGCQATIDVPQRRFALTEAAVMARDEFTT
jgi:muramoyltetrapeptide carboxypeptidase